MKKYFALCLALAVFCLSLTGCSGITVDGNASNLVTQEPQSGGVLNLTIPENDLTTLVTSKVSENTQTVVYENVEMRYYEEDGGSIAPHPYVHNIRTNNTSKIIVGQQRGMLAYDKDGQPLKIDWYANMDPTFYFLYDRGIDIIDILPGETSDLFGGWSLNISGNNPSVNEIAYVLYCDKEITFEDGTVWLNPDFDEWLNTYEGKAIDIKVLESYYPYVQKIVF